MEELTCLLVDGRASGWAQLAFADKLCLLLQLVASICRSLYFGVGVGFWQRLLVSEAQHHSSELPSLFSYLWYLGQSSLSWP